MQQKQGMNRRRQIRRGTQALFYDSINDRRRRGYDRRAQDATAPAVPGTIRPAPGEAAPFVERRRVPESGME